ncbi:hypothetical protein EET67_04340 [Pseudaminobacter arsenicus]|uniref:Uncharacterized protein n=1 Tax=Borborobacter arsenicus TaxID=1851146 RepID=A0A432V9N8_9HYPH|nr:hypothetical protein [Pseudaminobacter arsenicus]RUM98880.1 hypothetical protein EET67_04340 [Pseudaminobacter arsenicus]
MHKKQRILPLRTVDPNGGNAAAFGSQPSQQHPPMLHPIVIMHGKTSPAIAKKHQSLASDRNSHKICPAAGHELSGRTIVLRRAGWQVKAPHNDPPDSTRFEPFSNRSRQK